MICSSDSIIMGIKLDSKNVKRDTLNKIEAKLTGWTNLDQNVSTQHQSFILQIKEYYKQNG